MPIDNSYSRASKSLPAFVDLHMGLGMLPGGFTLSLLGSGRFWLRWAVILGHSVHKDGSKVVCWRAIEFRADD